MEVKRLSGFEVYLRSSQYTTRTNSGDHQIALTLVVNDMRHATQIYYFHFCGHIFLLPFIFNDITLHLHDTPYSFRSSMKPCASVRTTAHWLRGPSHDLHTLAPSCENSHNVFVDTTLELWATYTNSQMYVDIWSLEPTRARHDFVSSFNSLLTLKLPFSAGHFHRSVTLGFL